MQFSIDQLRQQQLDYGTVDWSQWNAVRFPMWDYCRYAAAGTNQVPFFTVANGGTDPVSLTAKTWEETNLSKVKSFGPVYYALQEIRIHAQILVKARQPTAMSTDANLIYTTLSNMMPKYLELLRRGVFNLKLSNRNFLSVDQPFQTMSPGIGVHIRQHAAWYGTNGFNDFSTWVQQDNSIQNRFKVEPFLIIEPETVIEPTIDFDTLSPVFTGLVDGVDPKIQIGCIFDGYLIRPGQ